MLKEGNFFWDALPLVLIVGVVCGSLFFVDFTGMVVSCTDGDGDGYTYCDGCGILEDFSGMGTEGKDNPRAGRDIVVYEELSKIKSYEISTDSEIIWSTDESFSPSVYSSLNNHKVAWVGKNAGKSYVTIDIGGVETDYLVDTRPKLNVHIGKDYTVFQVFNALTRNDIAVISHQDNSVEGITQSGNQIFPSVYENKVVYQDNLDGDFDIYLIDDISVLFNGMAVTSTKIYNGANNQVFPKISGNDIVFQNNEKGNWDIYLYRGGSVTAIAEEDYDELYPDINEGKIVWSDNANGYWNIKMYDMQTSTYYNVTTGANNNLNPSIGKEYIVWQTGEGGVGTEIQGISIEDVIDCVGDYDCDDTNAAVYNGATELCDSVDNNCEGIVDEGCDGGNVVDSCLSTTDWLNASLISITETNDGEIINGYVLGNGTCGIVNLSLYSTVDNGDGTYGLDALVEVVSATDAGANEFYGEFDLSLYDLDDDYYMFSAYDEYGSVESSELLVCDDIADCVIDTEEEELELPTTENCLYEGSEYNFFIDYAYEYINAISVSEDIILFSLNDGSCGSVEFHLYSMMDNGDGTFITGTFIESISTESFAEEGLYYDLGYWTAVEGYYYFVVVAGEYATYSDSLCVGDTCSGESIVASDVDSIIVSYGTATSGGEEESTPGSPEEDCALQWDCTGVEWEECDLNTNTQMRDLSMCIMPSSADCLNDESSWPDYEKSCDSEDVDDDYRAATDVPIFGWFNMLIVLFVLIGYYWYKR